MNRESADIAMLREELGVMLATFRRAARMSQAQLGTATHYDRTSINKIEHGQQLPDRPFWRTADDALAARGVLRSAYDSVVAAKYEHASQQREIEYGQHLAAAERLLTSRPGADGLVPHDVPGQRFAFPVTAHADSAYLDAIRQYIWHIVELDNRFGGTDLARIAVRFFRSVHHQLGTGAYEPAVERDLQAAAGELAEVAAWLSYDADRQADVRRLNHEALYFSRLAGDRRMELLTLQNSSMHAGFLGRPREALDLARSVLESRDRLSPRVQTLFLTRKARALAQGGDSGALQLFAQARSSYQDGVRDSDPAWAWWVDERELAWHEGMAQLDLGNAAAAVEHFEQSVVATPAFQMRSRYLHLGYLLSAQARVRSWDDAATTMNELLPLAAEVASTRTEVLLGAILPGLTAPDVPGAVRTTAEHISHVLRGAHD